MTQEEKKPKRVIRCENIWAVRGINCFKKIWYFLSYRNFLFIQYIKENVCILAREWGKMGHLHSVVTPRSTNKLDELCTFFVIFLHFPRKLRNHKAILQETYTKITD